MKNKINSAFHSAYNIMYNYVKNNSDIKKAVIFGNALNVNDPVDIDEEMHVAIYLKNPTPDKIESIAMYVNNNIFNTWCCMIDDSKYDDCPILKQAISKGVTIYENES